MNKLSLSNTIYAVNLLHKIEKTNDLVFLYLLLKYKKKLIHFMITTNPLIASLIEFKRRLSASFECDQN